MEIIGRIRGMAVRRAPERTLTSLDELIDEALVFLRHEVEARHETLLCVVEDSGPGIALNHLDSLFESFFTTKENGMVMGLPICRSIIETHSGRISADNQSVHGGARFYFTIPIATAG